MDVNGDAAHPVYQFLKSEKKQMFMERIKWNFEVRARRAAAKSHSCTPQHAGLAACMLPLSAPVHPYNASALPAPQKFLVDRNGQVVERFSSAGTPESHIKPAVEKLL